MKLLNDICKVKSKNNMIIVCVVVLVIIGCGWFLMCGMKDKSHQPQQRTSEALPPLRSNEQMLEFILKSAKEKFGGNNSIIKEYGYCRNIKSLQLILPGIADNDLIIIHPCADKIEYDSVCQQLYIEASTKFRSYPALEYHYDNMIIVYYSSEEHIQEECFLESVVMDTREGIVLARQWQEWLAQKGVEMTISNAGFGFVDLSFLWLLGGVYQILPLQVDGCTVELVCCPDAVSAGQLLKNFGHMCSVMDMVEGRDYYYPERYGRFLVMYNRDNKQTEHFIKEFWSKQNLN